MESLLPHPTLDAIIERLTDEGLIGMHEAAAILKRHPATLTRWALRPDECRRAWRSLMSDEARLAAVLAGAKGNGGAYAALGRAAGRPEADYYLEPDHPLTPRLIRAAKHYPAAFAMSHQAHVNFGDRNGR
ncbi:MAG TPA: hypothetical protein VN641_03315, partial [Urbifossiella sp.]|nr:hypothetical protein [Urbifossiella sp.]